MFCFSLDVLGKFWKTQRSGLRNKQIFSMSGHALISSHLGKSASLKSSFYLGVNSDADLGHTPRPILQNLPQIRQHQSQICNFSPMPDSEGLAVDHVRVSDLFFWERENCDNSFEASPIIVNWLLHQGERKTD